MPLSGVCDSAPFHFSLGFCVCDGSKTVARRRLKRWWARRPWPCLGIAPVAGRGHVSSQLCSLDHTGSCDAAASLRWNQQGSSVRHTVVQYTVHVYGPASNLLVSPWFPLRCGASASAWRRWQRSPAGGDPWGGDGPDIPPLAASRLMLLEFLDAPSPGASMLEAAGLPCLICARISASASCLRVSHAAARVDELQSSAPLQPWGLA